jgi:hypothetical protein
MLLALQLSDMPAGYSQIPGLNRYTSNQWSATQSKDPQKTLALLQQWGRTNGYRTTFMQLNAAGLKSTLLVFDDVDVFRTADGAHSAYVMWEAMAIGQQGATRVSVPAIGDEVMAFQLTRQVGEGDKRVTMTEYDIVFRRGHVLSMVSTAALADVATVDDAVSYARLIDKRAREYPIKK